LAAKGTGKGMKVLSTNFRKNGDAENQGVTEDSLLAISSGAITRVIMDATTVGTIQIQPL
tara:strand:+ start:1269 stop:1448 length:180 start_codon:yes stop_codon:yes gene_type:complete